MQRNCKMKLLAILGVLAVGTLLGGCGKETRAGVSPQPGPVEVGVTVVKPERVALTTELPGRTSAFLVAEVRPQVNGIIKKRFFVEGTDVKAGELLYQIDPSTYQAAYASAKAALGKAEASVAPLRLKAERYKQLVASNAVSKQDYDDSVAALEMAQAEIAAARAAVESARINLAYTRVTAPVSGRIGRSAVTPGTLVTANQATALSTIQQMSPVYVDVTQSSAEVVRLRRALASGQLKSDRANQAKVKLKFEDGSPYPVAGVLKFSDVTVDQSTGSVTLRTVFDNPQGLLLPGMYVRAVLEEGVSEGAILVPQRGVTRDPSGSATVLVVGADEKVEQRVIKAERTVGDAWLVSEGLRAGDRIIVEGLQKVRPGAAVKAVVYDAKPGAPQAKGAATASLAVK